MRADTLIKNGNVFNVHTKQFEEKNIAILSGQLVDAAEVTEADVVLDAKECMVLPGLVDYHTHLFQGGSGFGLHADLLLATGVTTAVDMGSAGCANYEALHRTLQNTLLETKTYINISPMGQIGFGINEPLDDNAISHPELEQVLEKYADEIRGIKIRVSKPIVKELGIEPLRKTVKIGEKTGLPVCVHTTNPPVSQGEIAEILREGDIFSHVFHNSGYTILDEDGKVLPQVWEAKKRGVKFDIGNGRLNFNFDVAEAATKEGFYADYISTDATPKTFNRTNAMNNLPYIMSKFVSIGMPFEEVIMATTLNPAKILCMENEIGTLDYGTRADVFICKWKEKEVTFSDSNGNTRTGDKVLVAQATIKDGQIVYLNNEL